MARQFMLGVLQAPEGLPIHHELFAGNPAEGPTSLSLRKVLQRLPHSRRLPFRCRCRCWKRPSAAKRTLDALAGRFPRAANPAHSAACT